MSDESEKSGRAWKKQRERKVRSKKSYDEERIARSMKTDSKPYKGELEPEDVRRKRKNAHAGSTAHNSGDAGRKKGESYPSNATPARLAALKTLREVRVRNAYAQPLIETYIEGNEKLSAADRAFATRLVLGTVSMLGSLDAIINRVIDKPTDVKPDVRDALRISTYEIIYLGKQPHAAVDQGVELVKSAAPSAAGLGNAVLHRILEARDDFPFGDPKTSIDALALSLGFPPWLARLALRTLGTQEGYMFMRTSNEPAPLYVCINALKAKDEDVLEVLADSGAEPERLDVDGIEPPGCYRLGNPTSLQDPRVQELLGQSSMFISDASALAIAYSTFDMPVSSMLEIGAGRGTKTIALQNFAQRKQGGQVRIISVDNHAYKTGLLKKRAAESGIESLRAVTADATDFGTQLGDELFDTVFVDAPCSGLGTLRRHHEIRWRLEQAHIEELVETQLAMLESCAQHVEVGGQLIYSTCTITYEEDFGVVKAFLAGETGQAFALKPFADAVAYAPQLESGGPDAHFAVRMLRIR